MWVCSVWCVVLVDVWLVFCLGIYGMCRNWWGDGLGGCKVCILCLLVFFVWLKVKLLVFNKLMLFIKMIVDFGLNIVFIFNGDGEVNFFVVMIC